MGNKGLDETTTDKHESYGMIGINRSNSTGTYLFGSIMKHRSFVTLTIKRASRRRHLASDWYSAESRDLISIKVSHTEWGQLLSSHGIGDGVPCTIDAFDGKSVAECPPPEGMDTKYADDLKKTTAATVTQLREMIQQLSQALLPGEKALSKKELTVLLGGIKSAMQSMVDSIPFIEKSFNEEMEEQMNKAKGELEATLGHLIHNTGLKAIAAAANESLPEFPKPQLGEGKEKPESKEKPDLRR